jgi:hypothetical protein
MEFYSFSPLHHLLRCVGRRELMLDALLLLKKSFNLRVLELRSIVASNLIDSQSELILSPRISLRFLRFEIFPTKITPK